MVETFLFLTVLFDSIQAARSNLRIAFLVKILSDILSYVLFFGYLR